MPGGALAGLCPACLLVQGAATEKAQEAAGKRFEPPTRQQLAPLFPQLEILSLLGAGGMGAVYKARQPALDRFVALKILPHKEQGPVNFSERFNREARALARLSHPHIVAVHEFGQAGGLNYFIMEYVDGANLRQLEKNGRLSPREAMQIIPQICDALQYAHDEGVVHRDIKPENVLVDRKGRVKIADFGLAKILGLEAEGARLTVEGQVMGTPHYMAPEQVERPLAVDHRADIYSLGVVLYEMLTGDLPLGKFAPPSRKVAVDVRLDEVVLRALENDPERRYQHASEVKSEIQTISGTPGGGGAAAPGPVTQPAAVKPAECYVYWAGIPLAVERDGEREITWNGGITAVGIGILLGLAGLLIFRLVTGRPNPGLAGMPMLIVLFVLGAGFRWALKTPLPDEGEPQRGEKGTLIVSRPKRRSKRGFLALGSILVAVFAWAMFINYGLPAIKGRLRSSQAAQVGRLNRGDRTMYVSLPGRGKVELLALAYPDAAPNNWWRPDGTPIPNELWDIENPGVYSYSNAMVVSTNRQLIARLSDLPEDVNGPFFEFDGGVGNVSGGYVMQGDTELERATGLLLAMPPQLKTVNVRVGVGLQPWRAVATRRAQNESSSSQSRPEDPPWSVVFNAVSDTAEGAQVTVVMSADSRDWQRRLVAVDTNGTERSCTSGHGTSVGGSCTWTYTFRNLKVSQLREFQLQVQPVYWVEFRNVRLNPCRNLPPPRPIRFGPAHEITFSDFLDFDTGKVMEEPPDTGRNVFDSLSPAVRWMERSGLDATAGNGELQALGMTFSALENQDWDELGPRGLTTRLHQSNFVSHSLKPWKDGQLPSTFGFRTREGGTGILQLLAFDPDRPGVTLRYKLLQRPTLAAK
jgi:hypothetical protein